MKVFVYNCREFDEEKYFNKFSRELGIQLEICREAPAPENVHLVEGCEYVSIITTKVGEDIIRAFHDRGVRMISTRTIGYDHIDLEAAKKYGICVSNVTYSPECVADYTLLLILMSIRKMKRIMQRAEIHDFSLPGIQGAELHNFTVGVIGTGKIGQAVIKRLRGFGCRILAYDIRRSPEVGSFAEYVENVEEIYRNCDLITLHMPLFESNFHMIGAEAIKKMKDGVVLVNTARGGLIDTKALIQGLESGKISAAGMDVIEDEFGLYYNDLKSEPLAKRDLSILSAFPNVVVTPHMAFYTDQAVSDMVKHSLMSCCLHAAGKENPWEIK